MNAGSYTCVGMVVMGIIFGVLLYAMWPGKHPGEGE